MSGWRRLLWVVCLWLAVLPARAQPADDIDRQIGDAIERIQHWLLSQQKEDGSWESGWETPLEATNPSMNGQTTAVTYALLMSGMSYQHPAIDKALGYLRQAEVRGLYAISLRTHVWAMLPDQFRPMLERDARWLMGAHWEGHYDYQSPPRPRSGALGIKVITSLARTQYGVLGVWEVVKRGGKVSDRFWEDVRRWAAQTQLDNGGWNYGPTTNRADSPPDGGMTCAGLTLLLVAQQQLDRGRPTPLPQVTASIDRGLGWLDAHFTGEPITDRDRTWPGMYWYAIERVGLASGVSTINGRDWYLAGVRDIFSREKGGQVKVGPEAGPYFNVTLETAFSLAFLSRGRVPLWINKLKLPENNWNNRPNDLYFLTRYLSDVRQAELNWQVVDVEGRPESWMHAPVLYVSTDGPLKLSDAHAASIKRYLELGGMLLVNPEKGGRGVTGSAEALARRMYPDRSFEPLAADDPILNVVADLSRGRGAFRSKVRILSNGVRPLIVLFPEDWGLLYQSKAPGEDEAWGTMLNLYTSATDRGRLTNRLAAPLPVRSAGRPPAGRIQVVHARHGGNWNPEPLALEVLGTDLFNRTGYELEVTAQPLAELSRTASPPALVHLAGTDAVTLSDAEWIAVEAYIKAGGTVLVETVGGLGDFAAQVGRQIADRLGGAPQWLDGFSPVLSGEGIAGAVDVTTARYRTYCRVLGSPPDRPELGAIFVDGRPAVLVSSRDLSMGALGVRTFKVNGYATESARSILGNILLYASQSRPSR